MHEFPWNVIIRPTMQRLKQNNAIRVSWLQQKPHISTKKKNLYYVNFLRQLIIFLNYAISISLFIQSAVITSKECFSYWVIAVETNSLARQEKLCYSAVLINYCIKIFSMCHIRVVYLAAEHFSCENSYISLFEKFIKWKLNRFCIVICVCSSFCCCIFYIFYIFLLD